MFANPILDARYEKADLPEIVSKMSHLDFKQRQDLLKVLKNMTNYLMENWEFTPIKISHRNRGRRKACP